MMTNGETTNDSSAVDVVGEDGLVPQSPTSPDECCQLHVSEASGWGNVSDPIVSKGSSSGREGPFVKFPTPPPHLASPTTVRDEPPSEDTLCAAMALVSLQDAPVVPFYNGPLQSPDVDYPEQLMSKKKPPGIRKLEAWLNQFLKVQLTDGRLLIGEFLCTDRDANVILGQCREYYYRDDKENSGRGTELVGPRYLGLAMVPGPHIVRLLLWPDHLPLGSRSRHSLHHQRPLTPSEVLSDSDEALVVTDGCSPSEPLRSLPTQNLVWHAAGESSTVEATPRSES